MTTTEEALYAMLGKLYVSWQLRIRQVEELQAQLATRDRTIAELMAKPAEPEGE